MNARQLALTPGATRFLMHHMPTIQNHNQQHILVLEIIGNSKILFNL